MWRVLTLCGLVSVAAATMTITGRAQDADRGERILSGSCTTCHGLRQIQVQALDAAGWTKALEVEAGRGAKVAKEDVPVLLEYLVRNHGPLPEGAGKRILLNTCTLCHDLSRVRQHHATVEEWASTLESMLNEGAPLAEEDFPVLLRYLAANFRPE
jgi:cytochrome c5